MLVGGPTVYLLRAIQPLITSALFLKAEEAKKTMEKQARIMSNSYDIIGNDDIDALLSGVGAISYEGGVGAAGEAAPARGTRAVAKRGSPRLRYFMLPINATGTTLTTASGTASAVPQQPFKPVRFVLQTADQWTITQFTIANKPQTLSGGSIPGSAFAGTSVDVLLDCDTADAAVTILMNFTNNSASTLTFIGVFFGGTVQ